MSRAVFIGDSHTCGYDSIPNKVGPGTFSYWSDNNYGEIYSTTAIKPVAIYAMAGVNNRVYTDWLKTMFDYYNDIDEVFLCMAPLNRFVIAFDDVLTDSIIDVDHFTLKLDSPNEHIDRYSDPTIVDNKIQLFNKPIRDDYSKFPGMELSAEHGLKNPNLRKHTFMQVKTFFDLNSFTEKREFLQSVYAWDNICADNGAKLYLFNITDRLKYPQTFEYYGKLKCTKIATKNVEVFFTEKGIDHTQFYLEDKEHYNKEYHEMIANEYLPWLKTL
jgi:hypothetical protein